MRTVLIYLLIGAAVIAIVWSLFRPIGSSEDISLSSVVELAKAERVQRIEVRGNDLMVFTVDGKSLKSRKEADTGIFDILERQGIKTGTGGVEVVVKGSSGLGSFFGILLNFLPLIFFGGLLLFMMRQAQGAGSQTMNFGRSRARLFAANRSTVTFADVAGIEEAKQELQEVVEFLKTPERFAALGARVPRGVLLIGPPGTGKTLMAKAVAGEAGVPFFSISGSEFVEMFVGVGASRVRDLFEQAKRNAPCIVFIDEIDAVGRHRGAGLGGGHDEREQTLNQILVEMDGFETGTNIIVLAATNRPDILDPALLRPGRFDRRVTLDNPDIAGRIGILKVHLKGKPVGPDVIVESIAHQTPGFSGADLANLVNEAAILAARRGRKMMAAPDVAEAIDRIIAGPERKSRVIRPKEKEVTAYHEAGHALVGNLIPEADPVQKISVVARGAMGGYTRSLPQEDRYVWTKRQFKARISVAMGGRVAEAVMYNDDISTGASNDLEQATQLARAMVTRYGMSDRTSLDVEELPVSTVLEHIKAGAIKSIEVYGDDLLVTGTSDRVYRSRKEAKTTLFDVLQSAGVRLDESKVKVLIKSSVGLMGLGPRTFGRREEMIFLGKEIVEQRDYSDDVARGIDEEVKRLVEEAYERAETLLTTHKRKLMQIARYLAQFESVEGEALQKLFASEPPSMEELLQPLPPPAPPSEPAAAVKLVEAPRQTVEEPRTAPRREPGPAPSPAS
ncbi:MAG: ATP-dependent metallopeptidase FtsH/Yme1/Tma family protein [Dehalococcoidia bacterium]|nr:ATP-dependent metallopeptidase FtsH/Yme1/Tma family protein [Dehalococcoidia bacterium]